MNVKRCPTHWLACLLAALGVWGVAVHASSPSYTRQEIIAHVANKKLRKAMKALAQGKALPPSVTPAELMEKAIEELPIPSAIRIISCLHDLLQEQGYLLDRSECHPIMDGAIQNKAPVPIIIHLVERKLFDPSYMEGNVHYDITMNFPLLRIFFQELLFNRFVPEKINFVLIIISQLWLLIYFVGWLLKTRLIAEEYQWIGTIGASLLPIELFFASLALMWHSFANIGVYPSYLMQVLRTKRPKADKEVLATLFLAHGADPNAKALLIKRLPVTDNDPNTAMFYKMYDFARYRYISVLQLAVKCNMLPLVKQLIEAGADVHMCAVEMQDAMDPEASQPQPILVTLYELYRKRSKHATYKRLLDFAPPKSKTYRYLVKQGFQHYSDDAKT